jgi:DNA polymerase elongation subunit (family B)
MIHTFLLQKSAMPVCSGPKPISRTRRMARFRRWFSTSALIHVRVVKGLESVRRDSCLLVKRTIDNMINTLLCEKDMQKMVTELVACVESVAGGTVDLADLVISKSLSKLPEDYKPTPPHAQVALNMRARNPHTAPKMGDRVPYAHVFRLSLLL